MSNSAQIQDGASAPAARLPVAERMQADAVAAALDKVVRTPSLSNRVAAVAAVQAYLAATEHLWKEIPIHRSR